MQSIKTPCIVKEEVEKKISDLTKATWQKMSVKAQMGKGKLLLPLEVCCSRRSEDLIVSVFLDGDSENRP